MAGSLNANALTTLSNFKLQLSMQPSYALEDERLCLFINAASQRIESYCAREFNGQRRIEFHHGRRSNIILPRQYPIISIEELRISVGHDWTTGLIDPANYDTEDDDTTIVYNGLIPQGFGNVRLIYTAGYVAIPSDLEMACLWLGEWLYRHRTREDMGKTTSNKGDESIGILASMPPMISEILDAYRRMEMPNAALPIRNI